MADIFAGEDEDDLFSDILRVVTDTFQGLGNENQFNVRSGDLGGVARATEQGLVVFTIERVDFGIALEDEAAPSRDGAEFLVRLVMGYEIATRAGIAGSQM